MENKLKRQTRPVIRTLRAADIRSVMVTGETDLDLYSQGDTMYCKPICLCKQFIFRDLPEEEIVVKINGCKNLF